MPIAADARLVAQGFAERLAEADAHVLDGVMLIDVEIARGRDREIERGVLGQQGQHVVEEADAGGNAGLARAFEQQFQVDVGFGSLAVDFGGSGHKRDHSISRSFSRQVSISVSVPTLIRSPSPQPG